MVARAKRGRRDGAARLLPVDRARCPFDVTALGVDFACGGSVKWLCGGPGAAYLYVRPDRIPQFAPRTTGWFGHEKPFAFTMPEQRYADGVWRYMAGTPGDRRALPGARRRRDHRRDRRGEDPRQVAAPDRAHHRTTATRAGYTVNTPRADAQRGGTVCFDFDGARPRRQGAQRDRLPVRSPAAVGHPHVAALLHHRRGSRALHGRGRAAARAERTDGTTPINPPRAGRAARLLARLLVGARARRSRIAGQIGWDADGKLVSTEFAPQFEQRARQPVAVAARGRRRAERPDLAAHLRHRQEAVQRAHSRRSAPPIASTSASTIRRWRCCRSPICSSRARWSRSRGWRSSRDVRGASRDRAEELPLRRRRRASPRITLDRPDTLNSLTFEVYAELRDTFRALETESDVRAVVITGAGRGFCSGGSVHEIIGPLFEMTPRRALAFTRMTGALIGAIRALRKPVVAAHQRRRRRRRRGHRARLRLPRHVGEGEDRLPLRQGRAGRRRHGRRLAAAADRRPRRAPPSCSMLGEPVVAARRAADWPGQPRGRARARCCRGARARRAAGARARCFALGMTKEMLNREPGDVARGGARGRGAGAADLHGARATSARRTRPSSPSASRSSRAR